jgi:hypothetical protein
MNVSTSPADQRAGAVRPRGQGRREPVHGFGPLGGRGPAPGTVVERAPGGLDRGVDVGVGGQRGRAERFAGGCFEGTVRLAAARLHPLAVDEEAGPARPAQSQF